MKNFEAIQQEIKNIILAYKNGQELPHAEGILSWVLKLKPDVNEVMQIAAFAHDIERCINPNKIKKDQIIKEDFQSYLEAKREHARIGAEAVEKILSKYGVDENEIKRVKYLIENHEDDGDGDANIIRDADSLSYLTDNFDYYLNKYGSERAKEKIDYMFDRMSESAKQLGLPIYQKNLNKL